MSQQGPRKETTSNTSSEWEQPATIFDWVETNQPVFSPPLQLGDWAQHCPLGTYLSLRPSKTGFSPSPEFGHSHYLSPLPPHSQVLGWQMQQWLYSREGEVWQCNVHDLSCGPAPCSRWAGCPSERTWSSPGLVCHSATSYPTLTHAERPHFQHHDDHIYFKVRTGDTHITTILSSVISTRASWT